MELLTHLEPKNVLLVHGEKPKMKILAEKVESVLQVPCFYPPNHSVLDVPTLKDGGAGKMIDVKVEPRAIKSDILAMVGGANLTRSVLQQG